MELLLIPFLLIAGATLTYLGVYGAPRLPWAYRVPGASGALTAAVPAAGITVATGLTLSGATPEDAPAAAEIAPRRNVLKDVRPRRHQAVPAGDTEAAVTDTQTPDGSPLAIDELAPAEPETEAATPPLPVPSGPSPQFGDSDALMGQLLMELSIVRGEIGDLRGRVERLAVRHATVTRAPGEPRRRRMRRIARF